MLDFSQIVPVFDDNLDYTNSLLYKNVMINTLQKILPKTFFKGDFSEKLPLVVSLPSIVYCDHVPCQLSFYVVSAYRSNSFKFFLEMISRWLVPGKQLNVVLMYSSDFRLSEGFETFTVSEVKVKIEEAADLKVLEHNLPIIETELRLGMGSSYYAKRILELKGLYPGEKTTVIHEHIAKCLKRFPSLYQNDLFTEMQHVMVLCREEFKEARVSRHLSKIIGLHYLYRKSLREKPSDKRHIHLKLFQSKVYYPENRKNVLSIVVGVNFLNEKEVFDERHLIAAIQNYFPNVRSVEGSYFAGRHGSEKIATIYLEIEKMDGTSFSLVEKKRLERQLPGELKERIEPMMHPVFMPCNEEEIMRNILSLSQQMRYLRDVPQVFISFDQQSYTDLYFTVIAVRILKAESLPVQELFKKSGTLLEYIHDRCKKVGYLRNKYPKEASVFRVSLPKGRFVRKDHSIDLYKARQAVVSELTRVFGEIRDFNGGMISKQSELLSEVKGLLGNVAYDDLLLEKFFYSLTPVVMRSLLDPEGLKTLFMMQLEAIKGVPVNFRIEPSKVFVMIAVDEKSGKAAIMEQLAKFSHLSNEIAISYVKNCLGFIYRSDDPRKQREFCQIIESQMLNNVC